MPSLTSVANRYIALSPGPNNKPALPAGATLPTTATQGVVDLDQLFNTFNPQTRRALQEVLQGSAEQYAGTNPDFRLAVKYFGPSLCAGLSHLFAELDPGTGDVHELPRRSGQGGHDDRRPLRTADGTDRERRTRPSRRSARSRRASPAALHQLPLALRAGQPHVRRGAVHAQRADAAGERVQAEHRRNCRCSSSRLDLAAAHGDAGRWKLQPGDRQARAEQRPDRRDPRPAGARAGAVDQPPRTASPRRRNRSRSPLRSVPTAPIWQGFVRDFGAAAGYYDANGHYARVGAACSTTSRSAQTTRSRPVTPQQGLAGLKTGQLRRCPGAATQPAADGSSPFIDSALFGCDPSEMP